MKKHWIGITAIGLGIIALCFSSYLYEKKTELQALRDQYDEGKSKLTLQVGKHEVIIGGKREPENKVEHQNALNEKEAAVSRVRLAMISFAGFALFLVPVSWVKEKNKVISVSAGVFPLAAISWHFIAVGLTVGVAIAIIILLLGALGG